MKTNSKNVTGIYVLLSALFLLSFASCKKDNSAATPAASTSAITASAAVAVGVDTASNDSVYVVGTCAHDHYLDSVSAASLPAAITDYLNANYAGYIFQKAFTDKNSSGTVTGYVAIIQYNGNPVGLKFDASGNFVRVLEQREGGDLSGKGWHEGGRFGDRDGRQADTVALSSLPSGILSYFATNYPQDTIKRAYQNRDSSYVVFSMNNAAFATVFDAGGVFVRRVQIQEHRGHIAAVTESNLPASIQSYLTATYPGFVFKAAFSVSDNGVLAGYVVCIDANGTKYGIEFDASGNFVQAIPIR
ncbi:MAG: PepSY-like domain-containing protein [Bacteroidota bacterium]|nr:PepSY-like domain-containing protein [Bacteroidota bacterium]